MKTREQYRKQKKVCKKCRTIMIFKTTWEDDDHGHCGDVSRFECPKCSWSNYVECEEDETDYYSWAHD